MGADRALELIKKGNLSLDQGDIEGAASAYRAAIESDPRCVAGYVNLGFALRSLGQLQDAADQLEKALTLDPWQVDALFMLGLKAESDGNQELALRHLGTLLNLQPDFEHAVDAICRIHLQRQELILARNVVERALQKKSECAGFHVHLARIQLNQNHHQQALQSANRALSFDHGNSAALSIRGATYARLERYEEAAADLVRSLHLAPQDADSMNNYGVVLFKLGRISESLAQYEHALLLQPQFADALDNKGKALWALKRYNESVASYKTLLHVAPTHDRALSNLFWSQANACDWRDEEWITQTAVQAVEAGELGLSPWSFLLLSDSARLQFHCARTFGLKKYPGPKQVPRHGEHYGHDRIRIAYLSADFHDHATTHLMAELFELHDRARFSTTAISFGPKRADAMRQRLLRSFEHFIDVGSQSDDQVAAQMRSLEIDIAVDLKGYTTDSRPGILAHRPAPVQVSYLGHPGTLGLDCIDYVIGDKHVIPPEHFAYFSEKVVHLPGTYQANDSRRDVAAGVPTRTEAGLPDSGFVFCCFNNNFKIRPHMFDIWMRLLGSVEGSVLWLLQDNADAAENLRGEARARGIDPSRLVFAQRVAVADHLARHRLADLFLDTLPCNAHTTASDALLAGLPVITCLGGAFAARVAASLLHAIGLEDLVTQDLQTYEALAFNLAVNPVKLQAVRTRLATNRKTYPLFDMETFTRNIETAFIEMTRRSSLGLKPDFFEIRPGSV